MTTIVLERWPVSDRSRELAKHAILGFQDYVLGFSVPIDFSGENDEVATEIFADTIRDPKMPKYPDSLLWEVMMFFRAQRPHRNLSDVCDGFPKERRTIINGAVRSLLEGGVIYVSKTQGNVRFYTFSAAARRYLEEAHA